MKVEEVQLTILDLHGRVDFTIGTLSKAIGVVGGYVAGAKLCMNG